MICEEFASSKVYEIADLKPAQSSTLSPPAAPVGLALPVPLGAKERLAHELATAPPEVDPPVTLPPLAVVPPATVPPVALPPVPPVPLFVVHPLEVPPVGLVPVPVLPPCGEVVEAVPPVEDDPPVGWVADELLLALEPAAADELRLAPPALDEPPAALEELAPPEL